MGGSDGGGNALAIAGHGESEPGWQVAVASALVRSAGGVLRTDSDSCEISFASCASAERVDSNLEGPSDQQVGPESQGTAAESVVRRDGVRVLVAEDEKVTRDLISRRLRSAGYAVTVAADGEQALDLFEALSDEVDIVVSDILMPHRDGVSLARELKARSPDVKLLMISGQKTAADRLIDREVLLVGTPVMQKPFSSESLVNEIRYLLECPEPQN